MDVAGEALAPAQDINRVNQPVLHANAAPGDPGAEEQAIHIPSPVHGGEKVGHFIRFERGAAEIPASAEGAVVAVALADRGEQRLEQRHRPAGSRGVEDPRMVF